MISISRPDLPGRFRAAGAIALDLSQLSDLEGTLKLLEEAGAL